MTAVKAARSLQTSNENNPTTADLPMNALLPLGLAVIMLAVGLKLTPADFARLAAQPKAVAAGAAAQVVMLPLLAVAISAVYPMAPVMAAGFIILAACPGGITSNLLTLLARGDVALALSVTAISTALSSVTLPIIAGLAAGGDGLALPFGPTFGGVFVMTAVPVAVGMTWRRLSPDSAQKAERWVRPAAVAVFAAIVVFTFVKEWGAFIEHGATVGPAVVALNLLALAGATGLANALKLPPAQRTAIALECGLQNAAVAIVIGASVVGDPLLTVPAVLYALTMNVTAVAWVLWARARAA